MPTAQAAAALGESGPAEISQLQVERTADGVFLSATVRFDLPSAVEDALLRGVALFFVAEVDVFRDRWYWSDKKLLSVERHMRLAYQPLTRRWRLNIASGTITASSLGLALNQGFETLGEALAAMRRVSRWKIAEAGDIDTDPKKQRRVPVSPGRYPTAAPLPNWRLGPGGLGHLRYHHPAAGTAQR